MNGVLVIDKPPGPTSHDVVARVRRAIGIRKIGHTGTLDPLATGVLPLVVGRATRLASLLTSTQKEYVASVRFGEATPTYDAEPRMTRDPATGMPVLAGAPPPEPAGLTRERVEEALTRFRGTAWQVPPVYSAKKIRGVAAHRRTRANEAVAPRPVSVTIYGLDLESYQSGLARVRLTTSAGYYVRSFAHDLGQVLGCGAHLEGLRRERSGDFSLADAVSLEAIEAAGVGAVRHLSPPEQLLSHLQGLGLTERGVRRASHGNVLAPEDVEGGPGQLNGGPFRLLDGSGALVGIAERREPGLLHPVLVLM